MEADQIIEISRPRLESKVGEKHGGFGFQCVRVLLGETLLFGSWLQKGKENRQTRNLKSLITYLISKRSYNSIYLHKEFYFFPFHC